MPYESKHFQTTTLKAGEYILEASVGNASATTAIYFAVNVGTQIPDVSTYLKISGVRMKSLGY